MNLTQGQLDAIISIHKGPNVIELLEDTEDKQECTCCAPAWLAQSSSSSSHRAWAIENADGSVTSTFRGLK